MSTDQGVRIEIRSIPKDKRLHVILHEVVPEEPSFITTSGLISFLPDHPDELIRIEAMDDRIRRNHDRILESPPMMHVRGGHSVLAYYQDGFYRGLCLRATPNNAEIWFVSLHESFSFPRSRD